MSDFSELKNNKQAYTQPIYPIADEICIANNYASNTQNLQTLQNMTQFIQTYIKYLDIFRVYVNTNFDVEQLVYLDSILRNKQLKVRNKSFMSIL